MLQVQGPEGIKQRWANLSTWKACASSTPMSPLWLPSLTPQVCLSVDGEATPIIFIRLDFSPPVPIENDTNDRLPLVLSRVSSGQWTWNRQNKISASCLLSVLSVVGHVAQACTRGLFLIQLEQVTPYACFFFFLKQWKIALPAGCDGTCLNPSMQEQRQGCGFEAVLGYTAPVLVT